MDFVAWTVLTVISLVRSTMKRTRWPKLTKIFCECRVFEKHVLGENYLSYRVSTFGLPSKGKIFAQHALGYLPVWLLHILEKLPSRSLQGLKNVAIEGDRVAMALVRERTSAVLAGAEIGKNVLDVIGETCSSCLDGNCYARWQWWRTCQKTPEVDFLKKSSPHRWGDSRTNKKTSDLYLIFPRTIMVAGRTFVTC